MSQDVFEKTLEELKVQLHKNQEQYERDKMRILIDSARDIDRLKESHAAEILDLQKRLYSDQGGTLKETEAYELRQRNALMTMRDNDRAWNREAIEAREHLFLDGANLFQITLFRLSMVLYSIWRSVSRIRS